MAAYDVGAIRFDGEDVELREGRFDPEPRRSPVSGPEGMAFLVPRRSLATPIGGRAGSAGAAVLNAPLEGRYEPPSWG